MIKKARDVLNPPFKSHFIGLILQACLVGFITGLVVSLFRRIIDLTLQGLQLIYPIMRTNYWLVIGYVILMILITLLIGKIVHPYQTNLVGSGVPQIEAILKNQNAMNWWQILWRKFVGGLLAICPGLFLGREGPCIQMGAAIGQGVAEQLFKDRQELTRALLSCGVAAGLSAAFSAPIAGAMFLLEEIIFSFQPEIWITALAAAICSDAVTILFFGTKPCLYLPITINLPPSSYLYVALFGIVIGGLAYFYQYCLLNLRWWYSKVPKLPSQYHSIIPLVLIIPVGLWNPQILGGSHVFINQIAKMGVNPAYLQNLSKLIWLLILFFVIRFALSMISYGATVPGGIFMPILVLGAILGSIIAALLIQFKAIPEQAFINIVVATMSAYFGAIEGAPFTAVMLLTEMIGSVDQVLPITLMTFIAYIVNDLLGGKPIYGALREEMFGPVSAVHSH
ncbi:ClC family H(+)/Cl(-) exchange transporter [uncultured Limosilactobacillus sp.]|uniref:ClC family H(+)/Cl(-) exchange transporter n=1 Tax=uncultured Limosilactobacillus sp. TaxID=2837629 RepID=UPI0025F98071|nr:ClC family H(+)/Cl(-) exchange transporter [uncultured Limosilactobacillus sp.]